MKDLAMVTWTHSSYNDVFPAYFGNVKKYLRSHCDENLNKKDANGTSISDYLKIFKDYDIKDIPYERKPKL